MYLRLLQNTKNLLTLLSVFFGVFFVSPVFAITSFETYNVSSADTVITDVSHYFPQEIATSTNLCMNSVTLLFQNGHHSSNLQIRTNTINIVKGYSGVVTTSYNASTTYITFFPTSTEDVVCLTGGATNKFITPQNGYFMAKSPSSTYENSYNWDRLGYSLTSYTFGTPDQPYDIWISINGFTTSTGEPLSSIEFVEFPTSTCGFQVWPVDVNLNTIDETREDLNAVVAWELSDYPTYARSNDWDNAYFASVYTYQTGVSGGIRKKTPLTTGFAYSATPYLYSAEPDSFGNLTSANIEYTGNIWTFIITGAPNENGCSAVETIFPDGTWPVSTNTIAVECLDSVSACLNSTSTGFWDDVSLAFCRASEKLFKPSCSSLNNFTQLRTKISAKPPFGYFSVYSTALSGLANSTSTTSTMGSTASDLHASDWSSLTIFTTIKDIFAWFLWLVFAFYVYHRFKNFSLMG